MSDNSIFATNALNDISIQQKAAEQEQAKKDSGELDKDVFLELLVTQMENQNPLEPQDNSEFVAQLAQFSSVEGLDKLNDSFSSLASSFESSQQSSQALQASSMVGRSVVVDSYYAELSADNDISGKFYIENASTKVTMNIYDTAGSLVSSTSSDIDEDGNPVVSVYQQGEHDFEWDGTDNNGERVKDGTYVVQILADYDGESVQLPTQMRANVDSVSVSNNGLMTLNVAGVGPVTLSNVREIL